MMYFSVANISGVEAAWLGLHSHIYDIQGLKAQLHESTVKRVRGNALSKWK